MFERQEAISRGLADEVGNTNDALRALGERIRRGTPKGQRAVVQGRRIESVAEVFARRRREAAAYGAQD